jgi:hypothetical protein
MSKNHQGVVPQKVYVNSLDKVATVRKVEEDPVWGTQYFVSTYSREWGPEFFWVKSSDVQPITTAKGSPSNSDSDVD